MSMGSKTSDLARDVANVVAEGRALTWLASATLCRDGLLGTRISNREIRPLETYLIPAESMLNMTLIAKKRKVRERAFCLSGDAGACNSTVSRIVIPSQNPAIQQGPEGAPL
jgi:hypothetical protein